MQMSVNVAILDRVRSSTILLRTLRELQCLCEHELGNMAALFVMCLHLATIAANLLLAWRHAW